MHNGLFRAHFRLPARLRYCNEWEKELDLGNPVCGLALINLIRKVNGGGLVREGGREGGGYWRAIQPEIVEKYLDGFLATLYTAKYLSILKLGFVLRNLQEYATFLKMIEPSVDNSFPAESS